MFDEATGKVTFNEQENAEISRIIGDRLSREGVYDLKEIAETLKDFGYAGTPAEIKAAVKAQAEEFKQQQAEAAKQEEIQKLQKQAQQSGTSAELLAEIKQLKDELAEIKGERQAVKQAEEQQKQTQARYSKEVQEFQANEKYTGVDLSKLLKDEDFSEFYQTSNPALTISQVYDKYVKYVGGAEAAAVAKMKANADRSTASGKQKGEAVGGTYGLTARQQTLADENGISYKDYADSLKQIRR